MTAEIISVGTELLLGDILNTNAQYLATQLAGLGFTVHYQSVVGDNPARLRNFLQMAKERSDVLLLTGGLGPTSDDITKETAAIVYGDALVLDHEELAELEAFFEKRGSEMTENNKKQAMVPKNGRKLPNPNGTAPGAYFRSGGKHAFLMPGPPSEMMPMFQDHVLPVLRLMQDSSLRSLTLRLSGIGESDLENKTYQLLINDNPTAALYAKTGEVHIRITAKALTADQAEVMCSEYASMFYSLVGEYIYSENGDDLETSVVKRLIDNGETVATAESCTGGMLSSRITSVAGSSAVFGYGACAYANEIKHSALSVSNRTLRRYGAVSGQVAAEMAFGAIKKGNADYGVGITGIAGPGGGSKQKAVGLVYIAVASRDRVFVRKLDLGGRSRDYVRQLACQNALDMLRRLSSAMEIPDVKEFGRNVEADYERAGKPPKKISRIIRPVAAVVLIIAALLAIMFGLNYFSAETENPSPVSSPAAQGFQYGTQEYSAAALTYLAVLNSENPSVNGFLAFSENIVEQPVEKVTGSQDELNAAVARPDRQNVAVISAQAVPGDASADVLISGCAALRSLEAYLDPSNMDKIDKFSYFTQFDEKVYSIFAIYQLDEADDYNDGFKAFFSGGLSENEFLEFYLGSKARSIYDIDLPVKSKDSLMTVCIADKDIEGRCLYICGRLVKEKDKSERKTISLSGQPLLPMAEYTKSGKEKPDASALYNYWLRRYLSYGIDPEVLQIENGMPDKDIAPFLLPEPSDEKIQEEETGDLNSIGLDSSLDESGSESSAASQDSSSSSASSKSSESSGEESLSGSESSSSGETSSESSSSSSSEVVFPKPKPSASPSPEKEKPDPAYLTVTMNGELVTGATSEIIASICQYQGGNLEPEAIKAFAVCVHTWILNQQGSGNDAPEVLGALPGEEMLNLVKEVENIIICPGADSGVPAFTPWHKMSAKGTNTGENVWGGSRPYLVKVSANDEQVRSDWRETIHISEEDLKRGAIEIFGEIDEGMAKDKWITALVQDESGYVESLELFGKSCTGLELWLKLTDADGNKLLSSPAFETGFKGDSFSFTCYGEGHGCGLSLLGADMKAKSAWTYDKILALYFPETEQGVW